MGYIDSLMATNEQIVYRTRKHWVAPLFATATGTVLTVVGVLALFGMLFSTGAMRTFLLWGGLLALLVGIVLVARSLVLWWSTDYFVTNQKVMKVSGIMRKTAGGAGLEKINDVTMEQGILGRMLDYGTLRVLTAADESNLNYTTMRKPAEFRRSMLDQKLMFEQADARYIADAMRGNAPSGPSEPVETSPHETAAFPAAAPTEVAWPDPAPEVAWPGPAQAPTASTTGSVPTVAPNDIPALIERLAALRDAGAISPAEFDAKKAELLGRL